MTDTGKPGFGKAEKPTKKDQDELDEALEESFPASDPPAPVQPGGDNDEAPEKDRDKN